jgi:hypothetical protein
MLSGITRAHRLCCGRGLTSLATIASRVLICQVGAFEKLCRQFVRICYFTAPRVRPSTNDFWKSKNTIRVGMAAVIVPAEIKPQSDR